MTCVEKGLAIFGGTFDPIHFGHLRSAVEVREALGAERIKLIPSFLPPHRNRPDTTAGQRLEMLNLAIRNVGFMEVDDREIRREGKSFTIDTLRSLRGEIGDAGPLSLVMGADAWGILDSWRDWQHLTDYAHIVVIRRGNEEPVVPETVKMWSEQKYVQEPAALRGVPHGLICQVELTRLDISATRVREIFKEGLSADFLVPEGVLEYIRREGLYR